MDNLNTIKPYVDYSLSLGTTSQYQRVTELNADNVKMSVYFDLLESRLINHILSAKAVFGCVAWLTNTNILKALAKLDNVSIVVQKEDFLRPDTNAKSSWNNILRSRYESLRCDVTRYEMPFPMRELNVCCSPDIPSVRCMGNHNSDQKPAFPRMHNKFLVFCDVQYKRVVDDFYPEAVLPYGVWTGSFNFTENSCSSLENAIYINNSDVASAYLNEYAHIFSLSEPLDWETEWCAPEYRIGT